MMKHVLAIVAVLSFAVVAQAGVTFSVDLSTNSQGNPIYVITATSDGALITSLGMDVVATDAGALGQLAPFGQATHLQDNNAIITGTGGNVDQDTQAMFNTNADGLIVVPGSIDTADQLLVNFTGFEGFQSREILQVVLVGEEAVANVSAVAGGEQTDASIVLPEPASLSLLALGGLLAIRRR